MQEKAKSKIFDRIRSLDNNTLTDTPAFICLEDCFAYSHTELKRLQKLLEYKLKLIEQDLSLIELYFDEFYNPF